MASRKNKAESAQETLASVVQEMAEPRLAQSVRTHFRSHTVITNPKFCDGNLVFNCVTKEDGKVKSSYEEKGVRMCEVLVPITPNSWAKGTFHSNWEENRLELSSNKIL